jgi:hypothetical protein
LIIKSNNNTWYTPGIRISCKHTRDLYLLHRNNNDEALKIHYRWYCKVLKDVIREAKKQYYNRQALNSSNEIIEALNKQKIVGGISCDLKKAFDSVNHDILLSKLQFYGIDGKFHDLITSYLSDRYQRALIASTDSSYTVSSSWDIVRHGVPQGSILGPLFFFFM